MLGDFRLGKNYRFSVIILRFTQYSPSYIFIYLFKGLISIFIILTSMNQL
jgi:hypothetical protein